MVRTITVHLQITKLQQLSGEIVSRGEKAVYISIRKGNLHIVKTKRLMAVLDLEFLILDY